jgi:hypothetical protein
MYKYLLISIAFTLCTLSASNKTDDTKKIIEEWVETERIVSAEIYDWETEKSILNSSKSLLTRELNRLEAKLSSLEESATSADKERASLNEKKENIKNGNAVVSINIDNLEAQIKMLIPTLPPPLVKQIKPLEMLIPEDPNYTKLDFADRILPIVGILTQADKFNSKITVTSETRESNDGKLAQFTTLYWGLANAYYVDNSGKEGGIGLPTLNGWKWTVIDDIGPTIQKLINYEKGLGIEYEFVNTPAQIITL